MIPDKHAYFGQTVQSKERQDIIVEHINNIAPALAFVEGMKFTKEPITKESMAKWKKILVKKLRKFYELRGWNEEKTQKAIKKSLLGNKAVKSWLLEILNSQTTTKLYGVDFPDIVDLYTFL